MQKQELLSILQQRIKNNNCNSILGALQAVWNYISGIEDTQLQLQTFRTIIDSLTPIDLGIRYDRDSFEKEFQDIAETVRNIRNLEDKTVSGLIRNNPAECDFYKELLDRTMDEVLIENDTRYLFFSMIWFDARIPYYKLQEEDLELSNGEKIEKVSGELRDAIQRAGFIVHRGHISPYGQAKALTRIAETLPANEKTYFWAYTLISYPRKKRASENADPLGKTNSSEKNASKEDTAAE